MSDFIIHDGELCYTDELTHYGVKGMKWGVRKSEYKAMSKQQKKQTREDYKSDKKWENVM